MASVKQLGGGADKKKRWGAEMAPGTGSNLTYNSCYQKSKKSRKSSQDLPIEARFSAS
jgi:hypothetical protein